MWVTMYLRNTFSNIQFETCKGLEGFESAYGFLLILIQSDV